VRHEEEGGALALELADPARRFVLEVRVADGERFVDDQDVGAHGGRRAEGEAHLHPRRIGAHRRVHVVAELREVADPR
jgi:hypothetical protein